ncbi:c-type cytochrome [Aerolutibacter ruishenii]|uniref:Mono/diheme cytochrome c family protein n=1 Tax=Aerolutibacter ruishenii TaxID=686800 RepID=A0A562LZ32_9GAMM|nr:c-type cytochrome [Lysobacter ruishenii]TWI12778.1 mono/diheme cytochrome c family protein [Lysobacter ruishenii]
MSRLSPCQRWAIATLCLLPWLPVAAREPVRDPALLERGAYLAAAGDCVACHTKPGGKPFTGGLELATPVGNIVSANITPSREGGIGAYTEQQFADALRKGVRADGARLYPAMPYDSYALVTDEDVHALYAYFMHRVAPVGGAAPSTRLSFPFNIRASMMVWNLLFLQDKPFAPDPGKDEQWNRGAYLVRGLTHCGTCHTPRNLLMAEDGSRVLAGAPLGSWYAPNITSDPTSGLGAWSREEIVQYLRNGAVPGKGQASGPMAEAIDHSLQHLTDADLQAIAAYLQSVPARNDGADAKPVHALGQASDQLAAIRGVPLPDDPDKMSGPQLYDGYCATCHQAQAQGSFDGRLPALFHNTATGRAQPQNLVMTVLEGIHRGSDRSDLRMPGFGHELSDVQVATLTSYLREQYGAGGNALTPADIARLRTGGGNGAQLLLLARGGLLLAALIIVSLAWWLIRRRRRARSGRAHAPR